MSSPFSHAGVCCAVVLLALLGCSSKVDTSGSGGAAGATTPSATSSGGGAESSAGVGGAPAGSGGSGGSGGATSSGGAGGQSAVGSGGAGGAGSGGGGGLCSPSPGPLGAPDTDDDGDGWTELDGDCCEDPVVCVHAHLVNPGAVEVLGDCLDNDCNPATPDDVAPPDCSPPALGSPTSRTALVKAMDLCQFTVESPPSPLQKVWGVISNHVTLADGSGVPLDVQTRVLGNYGTFVLPHAGSTMAALSTGVAADASAGVHPEDGVLPGEDGGFDAGTTSSVDAAYLAANGGALPQDPACGGPCATPDCAVAYDSVRFVVRLRVPTNAQGFHLDTRFFTSEFPQRSCQPLKDRYLVLYKSNWQPGPGQSPIPADHNLGFDAMGLPFHFGPAFDVCLPPPGAPPGACPLGPLDLTGTGMGGFPVNGQENLSDGAATDWVVLDGPVVPGEVVELEIHLWDAGDHEADSLVLADAFRWILLP